MKSSVSFVFSVCVLGTKNDNVFISGEVENAEERTERAKACPCPVHAKRHRKAHKDRLRVNKRSFCFESNFFY